MGMGIGMGMGMGKGNGVEGEEVVKDWSKGKGCGKQSIKRHN